MPPTNNSSPSTIKHYLSSEQETEAFGKELGSRITQLNTGIILWLEGDLGAGKTTLSRGVMRAFGHSGAVKSPTYTIVEPYQFGEQKLYHFDLYRLADPEELEYLGFRDYLDQDSCSLIEWPSRGQGYLPNPDMRVNLSVAAPGRNVEVQALSPKGQQLLDQLQYQTTQSKQTQNN